MRMLHEMAGITPAPVSSPPRAGRCPGASPVRLPTRNTCVSTAMVGSPKATFKTTLAVLRPTPGSASSAARGARHLAAMLARPACRQRHHVPCLGAEEPDGLDGVAHLALAEREHLLRRVGGRERCARRLVNAGVGGLRRQNHRDQQRERIDMPQLALRLRIGLAKTAERLMDLGRRPGPWLLCGRARSPPGLAAGRSCDFLMRLETGSFGLACGLRVLFAIMRVY